MLPANLFEQQFLPCLWDFLRLWGIIDLWLIRVEIFRLLFQVLAFAPKPLDYVLLCGRVTPLDVPA
ncbi:hypothetical protein BGV48_33635 [Burkholderia ubonensis]|nr:hypothetical protein BGV48_33635 [Burkholderia ubonensis]